MLFVIKKARRAGAALHRYPIVCRFGSRSYLPNNTEALAYFLGPGVSVLAGTSAVCDGPGMGCVPSSQQVHAETSSNVSHLITQ